jgi:hypothetical protein
MERIELKLNEDYGVTFEPLENGLPGVIPIITARSGERKGLSFVCESSWYNQRSDEPDNNTFTYRYRLLSYPENKKEDESYKLTEEDKSYILQLILNFIKENDKYGRFHTIWEK